MSQYNIIVSTAEATVVSEYEPQQTRSDAYQSEAALEAAFIQQLTEQGYTYLQIHSSDELVKNLREQLEKLNGYHFSNDEWQRFFSQNLANSNDGIVEKTRLIQEDNVQVLKRDDGSSTHGPNILPEIEIKAPEAFRASKRARILLRLTNDSEAKKGALRS